MSGIRLSVLIVTYNTGADIETCLQLLAASRIDRPYEVILVDNASSDGTPERVARGFPWVRLIAERTNHGFAGGNAVALAAARGETILLLNPDAFLRDPEALATALAHLDAHPDVGALGPRLIFPDGRHQVGDAGYEPRPLSTLVHAAGLSGRFGLRGLYLASRQARGRAALDVDWVCGAFLLMRRAAIETIGGWRARCSSTARMSTGAAGCAMPVAGRLPAGDRGRPSPGRIGGHALGPVARRAGGDLPPAQCRPAPVLAGLLLGPAAARLHPAGAGLRAGRPAETAAGTGPEGRRHAQVFRPPAQSSKLTSHRHQAFLRMKTM